MMIKNILIPIDFSECSKNALKIALQIAKSCDAKINMLNAIHIHSLPPDAIGRGLLQSLLSDYETQVKESFSALESELIELADIPHETDRFISYLIDAIIEETEEKNIDLIVMGTHAKRSNIEKFLGSHSSDVIRNAKVPVLVIPEETKTFKPAKIGFASDFDGLQNFHKIEILSKIGELYKSKIIIFHVTYDRTDVSKLTKQKMKELHERFLNHKVTVKTIEADTVLNGIKFFIRSHHLDLLALTPKEHSFFDRLFTPSISKTIAINASIPLLTIPQY